MFWNGSFNASLGVITTTLSGGVAYNLDYTGSEYHCGRIEEIEDILLWLDLAGTSGPAIRRRRACLAGFARGTGPAAIIDLALLLLKG